MVYKKVEGKWETTMSTSGEKYRFKVNLIRICQICFLSRTTLGKDWLFFSNYN